MILVVTNARFTRVLKSWYPFFYLSNHSFLTSSSISDQKSYCIRVKKKMLILTIDERLKNEGRLGAEIFGPAVTAR